jgi:hypothetical protein
VVDDNAAPAHGRQGLRHNVADVVVIAHAQHDQLGAGDGLLDRVERRAAVLFGPARGPFRGCD